MVLSADPYKRLQVGEISFRQQSIKECTDMRKNADIGSDADVQTMQMSRLKTDQCAEIPRESA